MKSIIYIAFIAFTSMGAFAQNNSEQGIAETTKALATKISQELNFDDDKTLYLYRALYSTEQTRDRAEQQLGAEPEKLEETYEEINNSFNKMLTMKFSENEIAGIKQIMKKQE